MRKKRQKQLAAYLLMLSLCSMPALAATVPTTPAIENNVGAYIYVGGDTTQTSFDIDEVSGWTGTNQGAVVNFYSDKDISLNGALQKYINNSAAGDTAGAIYNGVNSLANTVTINGASLFDSNKSRRGGAIYNEGTMNFVGNATFKGNQATEEGTPHTWSGGGAILNIDGIMSFDGTASFENNKANGDGGAVFLGHTAIPSRGSYTSSVTFENVASFTGNEASQSGGAIVNKLGTATFAQLSDGARHSFKENKAITANGGAISNMAGNIIFNGAADFEENKAGYGGGAIALGDVTADFSMKGNSSVTIAEGSKFSKNEAVVGGAISAVRSSDGTTVTLNVGDKVEFTNNTSNMQGGAIHNQRATTIIGDKVKFTDNKAKGYGGGAIYQDTDNYAASLSIGKEAYFEGNKTETSHGGAIMNFNAADGASLVIGEAAQFIKNEAKKTGGAISNWAGQATVGKGAQFKGNVAEGNGGAIYTSTYYDDTANFIVKGDTLFENNISKNGNGGAIYADGAITLDTTDGDITFTNNRDVDGLNDIYLALGSELTLSGGNKVILNSGLVTEKTPPSTTSMFALFSVAPDTSLVDIQDGTKLVLNAESNLAGDINFGTDAVLENNAETIISGDVTGTANIENNDSLTIATTINNAVLTNTGDVVIEDGASCLGTVIQSATDASITVKENGSLSSDQTLTGGSLTVAAGGKIVGNVDVTEDVSVNVGSTTFDSTGLQVNGDAANGHITGKFNLKDTPITMAAGTVLTDNVTLSGTSSIATTDNIIAIGDGTSTNTLTLSNDIKTDEADTYKVADNATLKLAPEKGKTTVLNSAVTSAADGEGNVLVDERIIKVDNPNFDSTQPESTTNPLKVDKKLGVGTVTINSDNSGFTGSFLQKMGNVIAKAGSVFFGGDNSVQGGTLTFEDGAKLASDVVVEAGANPGEYGTVNVYNKVVSAVGSEDLNAASLENGELYYVQEGSNGEKISVDAAGLGLFTGQIVNGDITLKSTQGVRDLTLGNGSGIEAELINLEDNTSLTYLDNAYITEEESTVTLGANSKLNFKNNSTDIDYTANIKSTDNTAVINKSGDGSLAIATALDEYTGSINVTGGSVDLTNETTATLNNVSVKNAKINFASEIIAQGSVAVANAIVEANESITSNSLSITGNSDVNVNGDLISNTTSIINNSKVNVGSDAALSNATITGSKLDVAGDSIFGDATITGSNVNVAGTVEANNLSLASASIMNVAKDLTATGLVSVSGANSGLNLGGDATVNALTLADAAVLQSAGNINVATNLTVGTGAAGEAAPTLNLMNGKDSIITAANTVLNSNMTVLFDSNGVNSSDVINTATFADNGNKLIIGGVNFTASPRDYQFSIDASNIINSADGNKAQFGESTFVADTQMGRYLLTTGAGGGPVLNASLLDINPQMYRGQVATVSQYANQLAFNNLILDHAAIISGQYIAEEKYANQYAAVNPLFGPYQYSKKDGGLWYKAYGNFERISMNHGLSVGNNAYGAIVGGDFPLVELNDGWKLIPTAYIAYNGAHQSFNGVSMYQNGAQIGGMATIYKGDFFGSLMAYGGGYANDMNVHNNVVGNASDTTGNWFAGTAAKVAYNIHLPKHFILQPTGMVSYNIFGNQNYGSNFGALSMNTGFLNGINVAPGVNLIWNKENFSIYGTAQMVYNIMGSVDGKAGNIDLPALKMRHSYIEYGLGVMKKFKKRYNAYLQFTIRNGGRTGIGFQGGIQIKIGK